MWTERPNSLVDGAVLAVIVGMGLGAIVTAWNAQSMPAQSRCQEVVVTVINKGGILAQCPAGTHAEIVDDEAVICRCPEQEFNPEPSTAPEPADHPAAPHHDLSL